tara:strand:- start:309 stop:1079 length:771 start_codon:yes stop_codon:yes gene_type:complete
MKKAWILLVFVFLSISLVSALQSPSEGARAVVDTTIDILQPLAGGLFGGFGSENLFESVLFFAIILSLVYVILGRVDLFYDKNKVRWVVTIAVALLATRFTAEWAWVQFVLLPYSILGVALLSLLPFIIYFSFLYSFDSGTIRKFGWALFIAIYTGLWYSQFEQIGDIAWIYLFAGILGLIMIVSDKYVRGWMVRQSIAKGLTADAVRQIIDLRKDRKKLMEQLGNVSSPSERRIINQELDKLDKTIRRLSRHPLS